MGPQHRAPGHLCGRYAPFYLRRQLAFVWEETQGSLQSCPRAALTLLSSVIASPKGLNHLDRLHTLPRSPVTVIIRWKELAGAGVRGLGETPEPCRT